jgi:hypothetical protein
MEFAISTVIDGKRPKDAIAEGKRHETRGKKKISENEGYHHQKKGRTGTVDET